MPPQLASIVGRSLSSTLLHLASSSSSSHSAADAVVALVARRRPAQPLRRRLLHLAPPFLLDEPYVPRYAQLSEASASRKRAAAHAHLAECNLCPRRCGVNRYQTTGQCLVGENVKVNVIAPHFGEEPCIQGHNGSGAVFFSGCNLRCVFCQNYEISHQRNGFDLSPTELAEWFVKLQDVGGAHNVNLVTPEHVAPQVALAILSARESGRLRIPIVYNTSAFDSPASLALLDGLVDVYLPDFKVWERASSRRLLKADDYAAAARESIAEMHRQVGDLCFTPDGIAKRGLLVRHLVMPGLEDEGASIVRWLAENVSRDCYVNVMEQYRPDAHVGKPGRGRRGVKAKTGEEDEAGPNAAAEPHRPRYAEINRPVERREISVVRKAAEDAGLWRFADPPRHDGFSL